MSPYVVISDFHVNSPPIWSSVTRYLSVKGKRSNRIAIHAPVSFDPRNKKPSLPPSPPLFQIQPPRKKVSREIISETLFTDRSRSLSPRDLWAYLWILRVPEIFSTSSPGRRVREEGGGNSGLENRIDSVSRSRGLGRREILEGPDPICL